MIRKKISELPECTSFKGLWTIGVNALNKSVKVSLEYIQSVVDGMKSATKDATDATSSANSAAQTANNAAQGAQAATTAAIEAKEDCEEATESAREATTAADDATASLVAFLGSILPTALSVEELPRLTVGNVYPVRIKAVLSPEGVRQNIIYLSDNKAVTVSPDGRLTIVGKGRSTVQVIPTVNTALAKTLEVVVGEPTLRLVTRNSLRLTASGALRLN